MAQNYQLDPQSGLPVLQTPNGPGLPLPLSALQMQQAGAQLAPPPGIAANQPPPPQGMLAANDNNAPYRVHLRDPNQFDLSKLDNSGPNYVHVGAPNPMFDAYRQRLDAPAVAPPPKPPVISWGPTADEKPKLAEPKQPEPAAGSAEADPNQVDPDVAQAMKEAGGGSGGPAHLGVSKEKRKFDMRGPVDPLLKAKLTAGQDQLDASEEARAADHAEGQHSYLAAQYAEQQSRADEIQADRVKRAATDSELQRLQNVRAQREQEAASLKAPQMEDYWKDKSVGAKVATAISMICGGWLQGYRGGSNPGVDALNTNIDRWIQGQKEEYERAKGRISAADNQYKQALDVYGSPAQAEADLRLRTYAVRDSMLTNAAQQIGTDDAMKNAQLAIQAGQQQRLQAQAQAQQSAKVEVEQDLSMQGGYGGNTTLKKLEAGAKATEAKDKINHVSKKGAPDTEVRFPDGSVGYDRSSDNAVKTQNTVRANDEVISGVQELKQLTAVAASRAPGSPERAAAQVKARALLFKVHDAMGVSGFKGPVVDIVHEMVGNPDSLFRAPNTAAQLDAVSQQAQQNLHYTKKYLNARPGAGGGSAAAPQAPSAEDVEE